ncbi:molybdopterin-containing oxidoreductase family protein [Alkalibacter mobilis]|uniref:molybdopterin-containing oxidoreductase family protein n=1 Tax=Alkalibacter mobilis TaxID=2787712 RepID=UPI0018A0DA8E|nr:molybdopterin-dependent oxidoreductase [Alkalibacter mobilis]MBF7097372.1 molybdopterin-dependent oxidoreductase [Alkalibacter mobilis]
MAEHKKITCPLDCFDLCLIDVEVEAGNIISIKGNPDHPLTKGVICSKGRNHLNRHNSKERILSPKIKVNGSWKNVGYSEAVDEVAKRIKNIDSKDILYYTDSGHGGISKSGGEIFFGNLGPVTTHRGSLCWDAGNYALTKTLGELRGIHYSEVADCDVLLLWGRNAVDTNLHLYMYAKKNNKKIIYIDPIKTSTASVASEYYQIAPNSDLYLVIGILKIIKENIPGLNEIDGSEILDGYDMGSITEKTSLSIDQIRSLADIFIGDLKVISYIGYGLQRYKNGAETVEGILKVHYYSGKYNRKGCGFAYSDKRVSRKIHKKFKVEGVENITFVKSKFGEYVNKRGDLKAIFIEKSNPVVQLPNTIQVIESLESIPFKVGIDVFMTDTMKMMDVVFPAPSVFECEDIVSTSMFSPYLQYTQKCCDPPAEVKPEYELFQMLAKNMKMTGYPNVSLDDFLLSHIETILNEQFVDYNDFKKKGWIDVDKNNYNMASIVDFKDITLNFLPRTINFEQDTQYPIRLITPHSKNSLHSQGFKDINDIPVVYLNRAGFIDGQKVKVVSNYGELECKVKIDRSCLANVAYIYEGYWKKSGIVNSVTTDSFSNHGDQAAYYDTFVKIEEI